MASWFELELYTGAELELELDTTPPVITWGVPSGNVGGSELVVPYTINEPALLDAKLIPYQGAEIPLTISGTDLRANLPADIIGGTAQVVAHVKDEVWNETFRTLNVMIIGAPAVIPETEPAGGRPIGVYTPLLVPDEEEHRFPATVGAERHETATFSAYVSAHRTAQERFPGLVAAQRSETHRFPSERIPAAHLAQLLREDEELLLLL